MNADSSARESEVPPIVSASDRDPFASDLRPATFVSCALSPRVSFPGLRRAYPHAHALRVARRRRARRPRTGWILRRCLVSTRCWRRSLWCCCCSAEMSRSYSLLEKYLLCLKYLGCFLLTRVSPSACWTPTALPSSVPAFLRDLTAGCWSWIKIRVRARVTADCWSCVEIRVRVLQLISYYNRRVVVV